MGIHKEIDNFEANNNLERKNMLESLLSAYLEKIKESNPSNKSIKTMDTLLKFYLLVNFMSIIMLIVSIVLGSASNTLLISVIYIIVIYVCYLIFEIRRNKNWKDNLKRYYKNLEALREVLKEQKLYEKNKIKQLIKKYKCSLKEEETDKKREEEKVIGKINMIVLPMIGYISGRLDTFIDNEILLVGAVIVLILFILGYSIKIQVIMISDSITGERTEKKKQLVKNYKIY